MQGGEGGEDSGVAEERGNMSIIDRGLQTGDGLDNDCKMIGENVDVVFLLLEENGLECGKGQDSGLSRILNFIKNVCWRPCECWVIYAHRVGVETNEAQRLLKIGCQLYGVLVIHKTGLNAGLAGVCEGVFDERAVGSGGEGSGIGDGEQVGRDKFRIRSQSTVVFNKRKADKGFRDIGVVR